LLKILLGLLRPDKGTAQILNLDVSQNLLEVKQRIGVLHEKPVYPVSLTPYKYLRYVRGFYNSSTNISELLKIVDLQDAENRAIGKLSAGMVQRLGIAQALIGTPEVVFLDEPTANLDVIGRDEITRLIVNLHNDSGVSFFITSHILSELEVLCHDIAIINKGRIISGGSLPETVAHLTKGLYKIISSDSRRLFEDLRSMELFNNAEITGTNSITFRIDPDALTKAEKTIQDAAKAIGIKIYSVERADSLEDAFREVVLHE